MILFYQNCSFKRSTQIVIASCLPILSYLLPNRRAPRKPTRHCSVPAHPTISPFIDVTAYLFGCINCASSSTSTTLSLKNIPIPWYASGVTLSTQYAICVHFRIAQQCRYKIYSALFFLHTLCYYSFVIIHLIIF